MGRARPSTFGELYNEKLDEWLATTNGTVVAADLLRHNHRARGIAFERWATPGPWTCSACDKEFWAGNVVTEDDSVLCDHCRPRNRGLLS
jgi:hypothetical protein